MESISFQPVMDQPRKKDILPVQKFKTGENPTEDKLDSKERDNRVNNLVDLFFDDRGGAAGDPGGSEFQNRLTNFLIQEDINSDPSGPFMTKLTRKISSDVRNESNTDVPKILRGVASVASFLLDVSKNPSDPSKERILGFNKELDDQFAIDIVDANYEVVEGQMVVHKLHLVQVKSHESMARDDASKIYREHSEFVQSFEMMAKWRAARSLDLTAEDSLSVEEFEDIATEEILTVMIANIDSDSEQSFDLGTLRDDLQSSLGKEDVSVEEINFLGKIVKSKRNNDLGEDESKAIDDIADIIDTVVSEYEAKKITYKKPVIFADNADVKSIIVANKLMSGEKGGVLEDLTRDIDKPVWH